MPELSDLAYDKLVKRAQDLTGRFPSLKGIVKKLNGDPVEFFCLHDRVFLQLSIYLFDLWVSCAFHEMLHSDAAA